MCYASYEPTRRRYAYLNYLTLRSCWPDLLTTGRHFTFPTCHRKLKFGPWSLPTITMYGYRPFHLRTGTVSFSIENLHSRKAVTVDSHVTQGIYGNRISLMGLLPRRLLNMSSSYANRRVTSDADGGHPVGLRVEPKIAIRRKIPTDRTAYLLDVSRLDDRRSSDGGRCSVNSVGEAGRMTLCTRPCRLLKYMYATATAFCSTLSGT
jgi:hypothetical protein